MKDISIGKNIKLALSVLVCLAMMATTCFAYRIDYAGGDSNFTLSGKTEEAVAGQIVTLKVLSESDEVVFTRQVETNRLGEYEFTFNVSDLVTSGELFVTLNAGTTETDTVYKSSTGELNDAVAAVNDNGLYDAIDSNASIAKVLQIDETVAEGSILTEYVDENGTYADFPAFRAAYNNGLFLQELSKTSADADELYSLLAESGLAETVTYDAGDVFAAYSESEKADLLDDMKGTRCTTDDEFEEALTEAVIINELSKVSTDNEKWAVLSNNNDYLELNLSKYESFSKFSDLKEELFGDDITSIDTMLDDIDDIYDDLKDSGQKGNGGRGDRENVSVSGGLVKPPAPAVTFGFSDLAGYDWAKDAILTLAADGIINGKSQGVFAPADNVTRAEFAKIIVGAFGLTDSSATANFADTPKGHWSYSYVASAVANKIVTGVSANSFNPDGKITRQDMATICYRALASLGVDTSAAGKVEFADAASISDYAKEAVDVLSGLGIINGKDEGKFAPNDYATRAEAAKIVHMLRALD